MVVPSVPVAGMALILGIDRFLSMFRAAINVIGNCVATLVVAIWEREIGGEALRARLAGALSMQASEPAAEPSLTASASGV